MKPFFEMKTLFYRLSIARNNGTGIELSHRGAEERKCYSTPITKRSLSTWLVFKLIGGVGIKPDAAVSYILYHDNIPLNTAG